VFGGKAKYGLIVLVVGRRYMIYSGVWQPGDIWANRGFGRQVIYGLIVAKVGRRYMG